MPSSVDRRERFISDILAMTTGGTANDVRIVLNDGEIVANKDVLSARSDYFATMFSNKVFIEGQTNYVAFNHCTKVIMKKIIQYLFSGNIKLNDLSLSDLVTMMNMSTMMMLVDLKGDVQQYILEIIPMSGDNYGSLPELVESLMLAEQFKLDTIKGALIHELRKSLYYIPQIPDVVKNADAFKHLPYNLLQEILNLEGVGKTDEDEDDDDDDDDDDVVYDHRITTAKECFDVFVFWLSENDCTAGEKQMIRDSFNLNDDSFTAVDLLTDVRKSGLYSIEEIDRKVLDKMEEWREDRGFRNNLIKRKNQTIVEQGQQIDKLKQEIRKMKRRS